MAKSKGIVSIVVPCYNEEQNVDAFYRTVDNFSKTILYDLEILYVNDGSTDNTLRNLHNIADKDRRVRIIDLSRNFGKEIATSAGIENATGEAIVLIDGDGQHPIELVGTFLTIWEMGTPVVVGVRVQNQKEGIVKKYGSKFFYSLFNRLSGVTLVPGVTDFCLIDRMVQLEYGKFTERNRITRGLIEWLGYKREYVPFSANARTAGEAGYTFSKLLSLALNSFISLSLKPLYFAFYCGIVILPISIFLALFCGIEMLIGDPFNLGITGTAYLTILCLFLLGIALVSQGVMALYLSHIHTETQNRPLYVINPVTSRQ